MAVVRLIRAITLCPRVWLTAKMAGVPLGFGETLRLNFANGDVPRVIGAIMHAHVGGIPLTIDQVRDACDQGVDVQKIVRALVAARRQGIDVTFEQCVAEDLSERRR